MAEGAKSAADVAGVKRAKALGSAKEGSGDILPISGVGNAWEKKKQCGFTCGEAAG